ncbi:MAG: UDP-N-acetylglucosamine 2-epimerase (hydrolyzing) [Phycisphaeraceae bacterium]|nr:UDP-N-acetylglucosamine 2-epimerase (hydrolyzing) [Phycisphaeraceae bacterium]
MAARSTRTIAVVTGTRAEFGLLRPVMRAIEAHSALRLRVVAAGAHFLPPVRTIREVEHEFAVAAKVRMQRTRKTDRAADAAATGRGIEGFARAFARLKPDWVVVLGDRIEAFAAASAASIGGLAVAHIHGGDRAEGIADEAMRHAITKLSHLHCAATKQSAERIRRMGERAGHVHVTGSPAIDGLAAIAPMDDRRARELGDPRVVVLLHPSGLRPADERRIAAMAAGVAAAHPTLWLAPNHDPGREVIEAARSGFGPRRVSAWEALGHLPREEFVGMLKRLAARRGLLLGNSSAGLIECAALGVRVVNIGPRQDGRERGPNVIDIGLGQVGSLGSAVGRALGASRPRPSAVFGDGRAGERIAALLADPRLDPRSAALLRKRNVY